MRVKFSQGDNMQEQNIRWERSDSSRVPFAVYTNKDTHKKELDRLFYKSHWSYVGLEAEISNPGDFKRTVIGERSVIMTCLLYTSDAADD